MIRLSALLLLAASAGASAQIGPLDGRGVYGAFGSVAPERLLFPGGSSPDITGGARLSPRVDVQLGLTTTEHRRSVFDRVEVGVQDRWQKSVGVAASAGIADRWGRSVVRSRVSLGYDDYSARATDFSPDSMEVRFYPEPVYALAPRQTTTSAGKYVQVGASTSVGWPVGRGRVRAVPALGVAGTLAGRVGGERQAQGGRVMSYAVVPVSVRVAGIAVTATVTGGAVARRH